MKNSNDPLIQAMIYQTSKDYVRELDASSKKKKRILTIDVPADTTVERAEEVIENLKIDRELLQQELSSEN